MTLNDYTLYVTNIPLEIDDEDLENIFSNYGDVVSIYRGFSDDQSINTCFGFIEFSTIEEAEYAMEKLNGKLPYNFSITFVRKSKSRREYQRQFKMKEGRNIRITAYDDRREITLLNNCLDESDHDEFECKENICYPEESNDMDYRRERSNCNIVIGNECYLNEHFCHKLCDKNNKLLPIQASFSRFDRIPFECNRMSHHSCNLYNYNCCSHCCHNMHSSCISSVQGTYSVCEHIYCSNNKTSRINRRDTSRSKYQQELSEDQNILSCHRKDSHSDYPISNFPQIGFKSKKCFNKFHSVMKPLSTSSYEEETREIENNQTEILNQSNKEIEDNVFEIPKNFNKHQTEQKKIMPTLDRRSMRKDKIRNHSQKNEFIKIKNKTIEESYKTKNQQIQTSQKSNNFTKQTSQDDKSKKQPNGFLEINKKKTNSKELSKNAKESLLKYAEYSLSSEKQISEYQNAATEKFEDFNVGMEITTIVCFAYNPDELWLHKLPNAIKNLQELSEPLQIYCEQSESYFPQIGEICGALFSSDSTWYRARIDKIEGKSLCTVYFIDYGNTEIISTDNIRKLKSEFLKLPYQAIPCKLVSIKPITNSWPNEVLKIISSNNYVKAKFHNKVNGKYEIDLFDNKDNSLIDLLIKLNYAKQNEYFIKETDNCMTLQNIENIISETEIPQNAFDMPSIIEKFQQNLKLEVTVVISSKTSRDFWIHPIIKEVRENFEKMAVLNTYGNDYIGIYNPKVNEIVIAQSPTDHYWYRAFVISKDTDYLFVYYLDYGNKEKVKRVVPILPEYIKYPSSVIHCIASDTCSEDIFRAYVKIDACLPGKIISIDKDKIFMDIMLKNKKISVTGYPWWYDLSSDGVLKNEDINSVCPERTVNVESKDSEFVIPSGIGSLKPGMELKMQIVHCPTYKEFWVQPAIEEAFEVLKKLNKLNEHANKFDKYYPKKLGEVVIAQSINDKCWYRAYIINISDDNYNVCFLDYGYEENVKNISYISPEEGSLPCYALHCVLELSNEEEEFFKEFIIPNKDLDLKVISCSDEKILMNFTFIKDFYITVIGYPWYHGLNVSYTYKNIEVPSEIIKESVDEKELSLGKEKREYNISSIINTFNIGNKIYLFMSQCCEEKFSAMIGQMTLIEKIVDLEQNLQNEFSSKTYSECNFKRGDLVAAFSPSDNTWYRACVMKVIGEIYLVRFVDYGKEEEIKVSNYLEEKYCLLPSPAIYFNKNNISDNIKKYLNKMFLTNKQIEAIIKECKDNKICLELLDSDNEFYQIIAYPWDYGIYEELNHCNNLTETDDFHFKNNNYEELFNKNYNTKEISDLKIENYSKNNENTSFHQTTSLIERNVKCIDQKQKETCTIENTKLKTENNNEIKVPSILKKLCAEKEIKLTIIVTFPDKFDFWAVVCDKDVLLALCEMENSLKEIPSSIYQPKTGDVIAAQSKSDEKWYRAYVLNENDDYRKVRYVDYGNEEEITNYKPLSKDQLNVMSPIIYCRIKDPDKIDDKEKFKQLLVVSKTLLIKVNCVKNYHAYISILTEENELINNIEALPWYYDLLSLQSVSAEMPCEDEIINKSTEFKNDYAQIPTYIYENMKKLQLCDFDNAEVKIVAIEDLCNLYVQPIDFEREITELIDKITLFCENLSITSYIPKINEMVCAKFNKDNLWYRGCVLSSRSPTSFLIQFVDFGNNDEIEYKFLRPLPEQFVKNPIYGIRVTVEGFSSMLAEVNSLYEQAWKMKIVNINDNTVKLLNSDELSLNEKKELVTNEQKQITVHKSLNDVNKTTELYYYEDSKFIELPIGETNIIVTSIITPETIFCRLANTNDICTSVNLNNDITKFCIENAFSNYYPQCGEMCLARYSDDGLWYRAVPLKFIGENLQILFVDFGNIEIINFKDTRQMMPQFMNFPIQAVHCILSGIISQDWNTEVINELLKVLPQQEVLTVKVLEKVQTNNSYVYVLDIPFAREHLIKIGLVQSNC